MVRGRRLHRVTLPRSRERSWLTLGGMTARPSAPAGRAEITNPTHSRGHGKRARLIPPSTAKAVPPSRNHRRSNRQERQTRTTGKPDEVLRSPQDAVLYCQRNVAAGWLVSYPTPRFGHPYVCSRRRTLLAAVSPCAEPGLPRRSAPGRSVDHRDQACFGNAQLMRFRSRSIGSPTSVDSDAYVRRVMCAQMLF